MWEEAKLRFPIGKTVQGIVAEHCPFGIFVTLCDPVAVGLVQIVDFLDEGRMTAEQYPPVGELITGVVLGHTEKARKQVWLGMRPSQLEKHGSQVAFSPDWRTDTAVALARQMYESRDFGAMPILADALQDAGCASEDILAHCRGPGPHARGCWVIDQLLGTE